MAKKLKLTNGVSFGGIYTVTSGDVGVDAVAEVLELTVATGATADGDVSIVLRGATAVDIAVTGTDTTPAEVAALIAAGSFTGWTASATDAVVTFTATVAEAKTGTNSIDGADTGVTGSIDVETLGVSAADGSITFDFCSIQSEDPVDYNVAACFSVVSSSNVFQPLTDAVITYPASGQVTLTDGSTFKLAIGDKITIVAQRAVEVA